MTPVLLIAALAVNSVFLQRPLFPAASSDDAWSLLPRENPPLPLWARKLVGSLPRTTAGMLALDHLHRTKNPLGMSLAGKLRWLAADAMGCQYAKQSSLADLRLGGASDAEVQRLLNNKPDASEKPHFQFARKMTTAAYSVSDGEFAVLLKQYGPEKMTAVIHTLAFANFQNRIIMALGVNQEAAGSIPSIQTPFDFSRQNSAMTPARPQWATLKNVSQTKPFEAPDDWKELPSKELERKLNEQQARTARVPLPDRKRMENLPPDVKRQTDTIVWMTISAGYQPVLTQAWFACFREFQKEARLDRTFGSSLFWVVTRSNACFY